MRVVKWPDTWSDSEKMRAKCVSRLCWTREPRNASGITCAKASPTSSVINRAISTHKKQITEPQAGSPKIMGEFRSNHDEEAEWLRVPRRSRRRTHARVQRLTRWATASIWLTCLLVILARSPTASSNNTPPSAQTIEGKSGVRPHFWRIFK